MVGLRNHLGDSYRKDAVEGWVARNPGNDDTGYGPSHNNWNFREGSQDTGLDDNQSFKSIIQLSSPVGSNLRNRFLLKPSAALMR